MRSFRAHKVFFSYWHFRSGRECVWHCERRTPIKDVGIFGGFISFSGRAFSAENLLVLCFKLHFGCDTQFGDGTKLYHCNRRLVELHPWEPVWHFQYGRPRPCLCTSTLDWTQSSEMVWLPPTLTPTECVRKRISSDVTVSVIHSLGILMPSIFNCHWTCIGPTEQNTCQWINRMGSDESKNER